MKLLSLTLEGKYKGLENQHFDFTQTQGNILAFIGLNGSGKSQLLELIGETFAYLERWQRKDFNVRKALPFSVTIDYMFKTKTDLDELIHFRASINNTGDVLCHVFSDGDEQYQLYSKPIPLPDFIIGYSSGLNENLQRSFMKNAVQYFDVMTTRLNRRKELTELLDDEQIGAINEKYLQRFPHVFQPLRDQHSTEGDFLTVRESDTPPSKMIYLDYDSAGLLLASLSVLPMEEISQQFHEIKFSLPRKIVFQYNLRSGVAEEDSIRDIQMLARIAGLDNLKGMGPHSTKSQYELYGMDYLSGEITLDLTRGDVASNLREANYSDPIVLFRRLYKLQLLGVKNWKGVDRQNLRKDDFMSTVKKPLKTKLPLSVVLIELVDDDGNSVNFDDFSDGEAQLMQILAASRIFRDERTLFLFDEPETHLNPSWRTYFHQYLRKALEHNGQANINNQVFLSTHSPFMISSLKKQDVFYFERNENGMISMEPVDSQTYGASFDVLIKQYFKLRSLISQTVIDDVKSHLPNSENPEELATAREWLEQNIGDSMEKAYLLGKLKS